MEMANKPLLSICIPSYKREKYLKECLESIINQSGFNENDIEVVISDNASPDNTMQLVQEYQKRYKNIVYHRNEKNIGANSNILKIPEYANGEYIWLLSDDDMMSYIALETILPILKKDTPGLVLSKYLGFEDGKKVPHNKINTNGNILHLTGMTGFFDFLSHINYDIIGYMMLLSLFCVRKDIYFGNLQKLLQKHGAAYINELNKDYFPHSRIIFLPFGNKEKIIIIEKDLLLNRGGNISRSFDFQVCKDLLKLINDLNTVYTMNKKTYRKMKSVYRYSVFTYIITSHIRKYIPKFIYNGLVYIGRYMIKLIRIVKIKN